MITVTICEENEKIRTMTGDAAVTVTLKGITINAVKVDINITGQMEANQTANALGNAMRVILKEIAENAHVPESKLQEIFIDRFSKGRGHMKLKETLFSITQEEYGIYYNMAKSRFYTDEERELQKKRFVALYRVIEESGLEDEYREWKKRNIPELQD